MAEMTEEHKKKAESEARKAEEMYAQCNRIDSRQEGALQGLRNAGGWGTAILPAARATCAIVPQGLAFFTSLSLTVLLAYWNLNLVNRIQRSRMNFIDSLRLFVLGGRLSYLHRKIGTDGTR